MHHNVLQCMQIYKVVWLPLWHSRVRKHCYRAQDTLPVQWRSYYNALTQCHDNANESMDISDDITPSLQCFNCLQWCHIILKANQNIVYLSQYRDFNSVLRESSRAIWEKGKASETATRNNIILMIATIFKNKNVKRSQQIDSNILD